MDVKTDDFFFNVLNIYAFFLELFLLFKGPGRAHMGPYGPEKSKKNM